MRFENNEFYLKPAADMRRLFNSELPEAFDNTLRIAEQCNVRLDFEGLRLPHFEVPDGADRGLLAAQGVRARSGGPIRNGYL